MTFAGTIVHGSKHGRTIGYPTLNLAVTDAVRAALTEYGVYAAAATLGGKEYAGALFWGIRSLFKETEPVCEISLLDFNGDVYDEEVSVDVMAYIRPVAAVTDNGELRQLIKKDMHDVKKAYDLSRS